ncbi:hypothetical protein L0666_01990 [Octadecabacter sp. CECT 8868]|uniref:HalD/BesD family halogenase n=1 Tax=Octadecabacter algicola TaxID=2909342 RepID=UPI001F17F371|nr:hypothetical protein [Octadecabacter algicola]MCF2903744.1 hypothetical protein [Octadecabacter algicola]
MNDHSFINFSDYPITESAQQLQPVIDKTRAALATDGCAVLRGFLTPAGIDALIAEADTVAPNAHRSYNRTNAYFTQDDESLAPSHPQRRFFDRSNAFVAADNFSDDGPLRRIYNTPGFDAFIQACLEEEKFHRYADPLADVIVNLAEEGTGFPWHFDTNNFTVTLAIQNAERGGEFEYAAGIRDKGENFEEVAKVLDGTSDQVTSLQLEPGDLQLFRGRNSLHRVAPLSGNRPRYVAILSYVEEPGMVATPERAKQLYGRVLPVHYERAGVRNDNYID